MYAPCVSYAGMVYPSCVLCLNDLRSCFEGEASRLLRNVAALPINETAQRLVPDIVNTVLLLCYHKILFLTLLKALKWSLQDQELTDHVVVAKFRQLRRKKCGGGTLSVPTSHVFVCGGETTAFMRRACGLASARVRLAPVFQSSSLVSRKNLKLLAAETRQNNLVSWSSRFRDGAGASVLKEVPVRVVCAGNKGESLCEVQCEMLCRY